MNKYLLALICLGIATRSLFAADTPPAPGGAAEHQTSNRGTMDVGRVEKSFPIQGAGTLNLSFPLGWKSSSRPLEVPNALGEVILLHPKEGYDWIVSLEAIYVGTSAAKDLDTRKVLEEAGKAELTNSVEKTLTIQDFKSGTVTGSYFTLTDKNLTIAAPKEGEFKNLTQGNAKLEGLVISFRIVSNKISKEDEKAVFDTIKSARFVRKK